MGMDRPMHWPRGRRRPQVDVARPRPRVERVAEAASERCEARRRDPGVEHLALLEGADARQAGKAGRDRLAVARAITGTRWNGPRFFGLRDQRGKDR